MSERRLGTLVVNERVFPIARITVGRGAIQFWIGPLTMPAGLLPARSEMRIHAPDGSLVTVGPWAIPDDKHREMEQFEPGSTVMICQPVAIASVQGWPAGETG